MCSALLHAGVSTISVRLASLDVARRPRSEHGVQSEVSANGDHRPANGLPLLAVYSPHPPLSTAASRALTWPVCLEFSCQNRLHHGVRAIVERDRLPRG